MINIRLCFEFFNNPTFFLNFSFVYFLVSNLKSELTKLSLHLVALLRVLRHKSIFWNLYVFKLRLEINIRF